MDATGWSNDQSTFQHKPSVATCASPAVMTASERRRSRTTALLIGMAASYALLWFPFIIMTFLLDLNIIDSQQVDTGIVERLDQSFKVVSMMSICVNPFLYGFLKYAISLRSYLTVNSICFSTNFKREFNDIFNTWVRCQKPSLSRGGSRSRGYTQEFSSVAFPLRHESIASRGSTFGIAALTASLRRSFRRRNESDASVGGTGAHGARVTALRTPEKSPVRGRISMDTMIPMLQTPTPMTPLPTQEIFFERNENVSSL